MTASFTAKKEEDVELKCRDSSVGITLGYRLDDQGSRVRFPAEAGNFSLHHRFQNGSGAHPRIRACIQKFPDSPPGARIVNGTALCQ
jgi:hypothetical protein